MTINAPLKTFNTQELLNRMKQSTASLNEDCTPDPFDDFETTVNYLINLYSFPKPKPAALTSKTSEDLARDLEILVMETTTAIGYILARKNYCELSIELNKIGILPPAFRPFNVPADEAGELVADSIHTIMFRDGIVIDCHWLHCRKELSTRASPSWKRLFPLNQEFSFSNASAFALAYVHDDYMEYAMADTAQRKLAQTLLAGRTKQRINPSPCAFI